MFPMRGRSPDVITYPHRDRLRMRMPMRLLTAVGLVIFCTILIVFRSDLSPILMSMINKQKLLPFNTATAAQTIRAAEAPRHVGERTTVCGRIAGEQTVTSSRGIHTLISFDKPYPDRVFAVLVWGSDRASVGTIPSSGMMCASGVISSHRGTPEIVVKDIKSWYIPK